MKMVRRQLMAMLAMAVMFGNVAVAHDGHDHGKKGHDHEAMKKQEKKITSALSSLSTDDQKLAKAQRFCPMMTHSRLGAMGTPLKEMIGGKPVFLCCKGCKKGAIAGGEKTLKVVEKLTSSTATLAKLPMEERIAVEAQKYCAIANTSFLGSMGAPIKLQLEGKPVYLCCKGCVKKAQGNPAATLASVEKLKKAGEGHDHDDHKHDDHKH